MKTRKPENIYDLLCGLKDPRRAQGRMHSLHFVLFLSIMGIMNGATSICGISDFAESNKRELWKLFKLRKYKRRIPSRETIGRILSLVSFEDLSSIFYTWASGKISIKKGDCLSLDGKAIRGTVTNANSGFQNFVSLVSVYVQKKKQILCLDKMESKKESEIPLVRKLIKMLDLEGVTFSMDALHCQKKTIEVILESKNNYIMNAKGNQPILQNQIKKTLKIVSQ